MSTAELKLNGTTIISESGGTATLQNTALDAGVTIPSNLDIEAASKTALNASGDAPVYACRAWVNFNGTGTVAIRESGNVSSITDNGTGDYTVNFTTAMPDVNYSAIGTGGAASGAGFDIYIPWQQAPTTTTCRIGVFTGNSGSYVDCLYTQIAFFR